MMIIKDTSYSVNLFSNICPVKGTGSAGGTGKVKPNETFDNVMRGRTDTIQLSSPKSDDSRAVLHETREKIMSSINRSADGKTLEALKDRIASGSYTVDPDELARILSE